ncbi:MAG TPA: DUF6142 family protein [Lachnospiraceae bacterium]|nr:DUF6142 family protein [Lachnospiraceae bacterium]
MAKPKKIKKRKSFMFTSRHQSEIGIMSFVLGAASFTGMAAAVSVSFAARGETAPGLGAVGFFAALANIIGIVAGILSLQERDIFLWLPRTALIMNILALALWIVLIILGVRGV